MPLRIDRSPILALLALCADADAQVLLRESRGVQ